MTSCLSDNPPSALIKVPSHNGGPVRSIPCAFHGMQGKCLVVEAREQLTPGLAVTVECDDALFLGEIVTSSSAPGQWRMEIRVEQILTGLQGLMALRSALLDERVPSTLLLMPAGVYN